MEAMAGAVAQAAAPPMTSAGVATQMTTVTPEFSGAALLEAAPPPVEPLQSGAASAAAAPSAAAASSVAAATAPAPAETSDIISSGHNDAAASISAAHSRASDFGAAQPLDFELTFDAAFQPRYAPVSSNTSTSSSASQLDDEEALGEGAAAAGCSSCGAGSEEQPSEPAASGTAASSMDADGAALLAALPPALTAEWAPLAAAGRQPQLETVSIDAGRPAVARLSDGTAVEASAEITIAEALSCLAAACGDAGPPFSGGACALTLPGTLHRGAALRDSAREVVGLTYRLVRPALGAAESLLDVLARCAPRGAAARPAPPPCRRCLLLLGPPGGDTLALLRDAGRVLSDVLGAAVVVVDPSGQLAGEGTQPHPAAGRHVRRCAPAGCRFCSITVFRTGSYCIRS